MRIYITHTYTGTEAPFASQDYSHPATTRQQLIAGMSGEYGTDWTVNGNTIRFDRTEADGQQVVTVVEIR